jgi:hypothetical protein
MSFTALPEDYKPQPGDHWITTTRVMSGYFAIEAWMNDEVPDRGPFPEPYQSGIGLYATEVEACIEAWYWAEIEGMPYQLNFVKGMPEFDQRLEQEIREGQGNG